MSQNLILKAHTCQIWLMYVKIILTAVITILFFLNMLLFTIVWLVPWKLKKKSWKNVFPNNYTKKNLFLKVSSSI